MRVLGGAGACVAPRCGAGREYVERGSRARERGRGHGAQKVVVYRRPHLQLSWRGVGVHRLVPDFPVPVEAADELDRRGPSRREIELMAESLIELVER